MTSQFRKGPYASSNSGFGGPHASHVTNEFVSACSAKPLIPPPAGLPWSHIAVDFVKGLPLSEGNIAILTIVDRFSKAVHFVPLPQLLSALETTYPSGHFVRQEATVYFPGVKGNQCLSVSSRATTLRPTGRWSGRTGTQCIGQTSHLLFHSSSLGGVRT